MATGDQSDLLSRLQALVPNGWFQTGLVPIRDAILTGFANAFAFLYSAIAYVRLQARVSTATDGFLDLIALDFFGPSGLPRNGLSDMNYRAEIEANLFRQRGTRASIILIVQQLLGTTPVIIEPARAADLGAYDTPGTFYYDSPLGIWGSYEMPLGCFVIVQVPNGHLVPFVAGYGNPVGALSTGSQIEYIGKSTVNGLTAATIYAAIASVRPVCGEIWVLLEG